MKTTLKVISVIIALLLLALPLASCGKSGDGDESAASNNKSEQRSDVSNDGFATAAAEEESAAQNDDTGEIVTDDDGGAMFADGDRKDVTKESFDATIILAGSQGTISDTTRGTSGSEVKITSKGVYHVVGTSENVTIRIADENESGNVYLILDNVTMTNTSVPCVYVEHADKVILQCVGANTMTFGADDADLDGAVYAKDDLTVNGSGSLEIDSTLNGIVAKNDLKLLDATVDVDAKAVGIKADDSVRVSGAALIVKSGRDGIQVNNSDGDSFLYFESGSATVTAGYDGIDVGTDADAFYGYISILGGTMNVTSGGGSENPKSSDTSQKGIKCDGSIIIGDAELNISSADDAVSSGYNVEINGGAATLSSSDDGVHSENILTISGGVVSVMKSYEGLEAYEINITGGDISINASDDGINVGGGSDSSSDEAVPSSWSSANGALTISGGTLYVNANGDGLDSNGSIEITDGFVIIEGASGGKNSAIDKGDSNDSVASITGGTVLAIGSSEAARNFDAGTQCSALLGLSGSKGDEISVGDGSGFTFTATKSFSCVVYSSPSLSQGSKYTVTAGKSSAQADFSSTLFYSDLKSE